MTRYKIKNTDQYVWVYEDLEGKEYVLVKDDLDYDTETHYLRVTDLVRAPIAFNKEV